MKRARFLLGILSALVFIYFLVPYEWFGARPKGIKYFYEHDRPDIFIRQCQYLEFPVAGEEAAFRHEDFRLRGIMLIFRHGERSPVTDVKSRPLPDCTPYNDVDRKSFESFAKLVKTKDFKNFLKVDPIYPQYEWHPHRSRCALGQMTAEGALQLLKLGSFLHEKYKDAGLFEDVNNADILISSSLYPRTFQSAIAFLSNFFYVLPGLKEMFLTASPTTYFCLDEKCKCKKYAETRLLSETERAEEFLTRSSKRLFNRIHLLGEIIGMPNVEHPFQFQDVMLGRYVCRRSSLPCNSAGECFSVEDFVTVADESEEIAKRMFEKSSPATRSMILVEARALLRHLSNATTTARRQPRGKKIIKVLSGHDITLEPLMHVLSIKHRIPPHYSSRLVFELYETLRPYNGETIFVRLLFNGKDHTNDFEFCRPLVNGLCRASIFEDFADKGLLRMQNSENIDSICL